MCSVYLICYSNLYIAIHKIKYTNILLATYPIAQWLSLPVTSRVINWLWFRNHKSNLWFRLASATRLSGFTVYGIDFMCLLLISSLKIIVALNINVDLTFIYLVHGQRSKFLQKKERNGEYEV